MIAVADPSRDISFPTMIVGLLGKHILPDATVLGFSRSGSFTRQEFLNGKSEVYSIEELSSEDVETFIEKSTEAEELREIILQQSGKIAEGLRHNILFLKQIVKIAIRGNVQHGEIATTTDLFLAIILGNLSHQDVNTRSGYSELSRKESNNLKSVFELCKETHQRSTEDSDAAGVLHGTKVGEETWQCNETDLEIPLKFLKSVGIFKVHPSDCGEVTLTAQHLSFIEFMAAAGILLSSDIKSELKKFTNRDRERFVAVSVFIREYFV